MSCENSFKIVYRLLSLQEIYGESVSLNYYLEIPPEYFIDAEIYFYLNDKIFFHDDNFCIYKFVLDASSWFRELFPYEGFIWNQKRFDGWTGEIAIVPQQNKTLFKVNFDCEEDKKDEVKVYIPTDNFSYGFAEFIDGFKETVESFWEINTNL